ncbi:MAG: DUF1490 domain-containing protein [Clostridia bacterium]|nr:DUF1490 domain-containing protein [Clostridia bacterium]MBQ9599013.1 DUF1490 domain-containing protein [Clostridia bacterium]
MDFKFFKDARVLSFIGGAAAVICFKKIIESQKAHDVCVSGVAKGMQLFTEAKATAVNIKEEAEDICKEARSTIADEEKDEVQDRS